MKAFVDKINSLIEALSNFFFAVIIAFTFFIFLSPVFKYLSGRTGFGWIFLTITVIVLIYLLVSFGLDHFFDLMDKIRKGELLSWFFKPLRNISSIIGIYSVIKFAYFMVHPDKAPSLETFRTFIWEFLTKL